MLRDARAPREALDARARRWPRASAARSSRPSRASAAARCRCSSCPARSSRCRTPSLAAAAARRRPAASSAGSSDGRLLLDPRTLTDDELVAGSRARRGRSSRGAGACPDGRARDRVDAARTAASRLYGATRSATQAPALRVERAARTTNATGTSPVRSSGRPTTAASVTAGCVSSSASSSAGATWKRVDLDQVLDPVDDEDVAVGVDARRGRRCAASRRSSTCGPRTHSSPSTSLTSVSGHRPPDRAGRRPAGAGPARRSRRGLRQAVALADARVREPRGDRRLQRGAERRAAGDDQLAGRSWSSTVGSCASRAISGGGTASTVTRWRSISREVEARRGDDGRARRERRGERDHEAHDVEERRQREHHVVAA